MNRAERRRQQRQKAHDEQAKINQMPPKQRAKAQHEKAVIERIQRNGITVEDLEENWNRGYQEGFHKSVEPVLKTCYAAICLALHELHGYGRKRCCEVLNNVDSIITNTLTSEEVIDEVWEKVGIMIDFEEVFDDRIKERV